MKIKNISIIFLLFTAFFLGLDQVTNNKEALAQEDKPLTVVAGTSLISDIVGDLTDHKVEMITLIPGTSCPGHNDIKTVDVAFAAKADLMIIHPFQTNIPQITDIINTVKNKNLELVIVETSGSWLIPKVQKEAIEKIAAALIQKNMEKNLEKNNIEKSKADLESNQEAIMARANSRLERLAKVDLAVQEKLTAIKGLKVAVSDMQSEFAVWAGLNILATYDRPESLTPRDVAKLVDTINSQTISGVIDNYQSGPEAGLPLSRELKVPQITISNFPGWIDEAPDYFTLLTDNVDRLVIGLSQSNTTGTD
ncbi:MAG: zinc ABC transporter substrate-binding protein [Deltaproteobacteria bacterium]|jgi:zinc transport system substrate-binding protein|nr:zinc ABC transporter substrate-binding protein [Deltaproteobacteria bacterium]